jgi:glutamyl-tRNA synthetase
MALDKQKPIRSRFAPSPTGFMHVGGVRTALYAWILAKQTGGQFILRIEDTDKAREVEGSVEHIQDSLEWLGLTWDEGPYKQSEHLDLYKKYAQELVQKGLAYADPFSAAELQQFREEAQAARKPFLYRNHRPENPPTWDGSQPLRLKTPEIKAYSWHDAVRGELSAGTEALDDFVILKSDGYPTYNFAHIIDDHEMDITHILRADEFLASVPKFLSMYDALGWEHPVFVTLPPIMGADGRKKLGKRDGAKDILDYKSEGYLPIAMINFLASLGWNDGTTQEIFTLDELITKFSIERIGNGGAQFDIERLNWMNGMYLRQMSTPKVAELIRPILIEAELMNDMTDASYLESATALIHERIKLLSEAPGLMDFFFVEPKIDKSLLISKGDPKSALNAGHEALSRADWTHDAIEKTLRDLAESLEIKTGELFYPLRIAITGKTASPGLFETMLVLGKDKVLNRIQTALAIL